MKNNLQNILQRTSKYIFFFLLVLAFLAPVTAVHAECDPSTGLDTVTGKKCKVDSTAGNQQNSDSQVSNSGIKVESGIKNPLGDSVIDIPTFITKILDTVLIIGVPIVALAIIYSGFLFVTAAGNSEKLKKAKATFLYTVIGAAILLGSLVIAEAIKGTVTDITSNNKSQTTQ